MTGRRADDNRAVVLFVRHLLAQRRLALLICVAALLLKIVVPTGYMVANARGGVAVTLCSGVAARTMVMPGTTHREQSQDHDRTGAPCAFAGLAAPALGPVDPVLLLVAIAFVMAAGRLAVAFPVPSGRARLRPPLRAPPAIL